MAFYMWTGSYSTDTIKAMVEDPQDREVLARSAVEAIGGKLHHYFFCFDQRDVIAIMEFDDDVAMAALSLMVGSIGNFAHGATTKLMTSTDAMAAMARAKEARGNYNPPS